MSRRVSFSPEQAIFSKHGATIKVGSNKKRVTPKIWIFKFPKGSSSRFSLGSFFRNIGAKVSNALPMISTRRKCSGKVSSSASLARSRSYAEALDSHRAEAIEDCIEFLNNPSLQRSSSVNSSC
ncbi:hypothetical protein PHJA_001529500 [Phtheirospermum japonicum]|uniref:Josephin-like protein n=1 Tax=Phtheirospermum japonicum TaxID=374723 RepID=A0A830C6T4_9LAMI|nr:hypothetical protein PHJA_001529500 [Phtheirospermum japonicum]